MYISVRCVCLIVGVCLHWKWIQFVHNFNNRFALHTSLGYMQSLTYNLSRAKLLSSCFSDHNELVGLQQLALNKTLAHKLHRDHRDPPFLSHTTLVGVLCLLHIVHNQVSRLQHVNGVDQLWWPTEQNHLQTMYFFSHYERYDPAVLNDFILKLSLLFEAERRIKLQRNLTAFKHDHDQG